ncbi:hypothetical protein [Microbacterium profundi]|uniref:hypothetical protein n=1 Tax=Microbacterium profundi TaxID=450380 RepID=UPI00051A3624|nr:hypothetical protein [Microbacterium profundi]
MTLSTVRCTAFGAALALTSVLLLASCAGAHGTAEADQQLAASCPAKSIASTTAIDVSGSFQSDSVHTGTLDAIAIEVRRTAICGGHLRAFAFASSTGATMMLYDGDLIVDAPTENAQLRKAGKLADQTLATITEHYDRALTDVTGYGSDPLGMLALFQQTNTAYPGHALTNVLVTDGALNIGIDPTSVPNADAARALADQQQVPDLSGAELSIIGIGKQGTGELPSSVIANLTAFWEQICRNTGASTCHVSTEGR